MENPQFQNPSPQSADGILVIDKPAGLTSHDVVARVRKIFKTRRVGHTGTLDPFATGVLVICLNRATRLAKFLAADDKEYLATVRFGYATDTGDCTGKPLSAAADARHITERQIAEALQDFRGWITQIPPMYSAKKIGGVKLYELARRGETIERKPIEVEIKDLELCAPAVVHDDMSQEIAFRVVCSSGTYVRTLAEEIGKRLGIGAHLSALRRTRAGNCEIGRAITLERLAELGNFTHALVSMADALSFPEIELDEVERKAVIQGRSIRRLEVVQSDGHVKLCAAGRELVAIADFDLANCMWHPKVVLATGGIV